MAKSKGRDLVSLGALAAAQRISPGFLEQILSSLRQAGYLSSVRGKRGGYALAKEPGRIVLGELVVFLEGPLVSAGCVVSGGGGAGCSCPDPAHCGLRLLLGQVRDALTGVLDRMTLEELAAVTLEGFERDGMLPAVLEEAAEGGVKRKGGQAEPEYLI